MNKIKDYIKERFSCIICFMLLLLVPIFMCLNKAQDLQKIELAKKAKQYVFKEYIVNDSTRQKTIEEHIDKAVVDYMLQHYIERCNLNKLKTK